MEDADDEEAELEEVELCAVDDVPGIVWALTTARPPTVAVAPTAIPVVRRLRVRSAASRAFARSLLQPLSSMVGRLMPSPEPSLGAGLKLAGSVRPR